MIDFSQFDSLITMTLYFNNEASCRQAIVEKRWGVGENQDIVCPYCGQHHCATRKDGKFRCNKCKHNFSCRVGTIFEDSKGEMEFMSYVHAMVVGNTKKDTLMPIISQFVEEGATVFTDELNAYNALDSKGYNHKVCDHGQLQFVVDGAVYTNNIEGFWSHFRRMITGCYHDVSDEHLQSYFDEAVYRWNTRKASQSERFSDMFNKSIGLIVTWSELKLCKVA